MAAALSLPTAVVELYYGCSQMRGHRYHQRWREHTAGAPPRRPVVELGQWPVSCLTELLSTMVLVSQDSTGWQQNAHWQHVQYVWRHNELLQAAFIATLLG